MKYFYIGQDGGYWVCLARNVTTLRRWCRENGNGLPNAVIRYATKEEIDEYRAQRKIEEARV